MIITYFIKYKYIFVSRNVYLKHKHLNKSIFKLSPITFKTHANLKHKYKIEFLK